MLAARMGDEVGEHDAGPLASAGAVLSVASGAAGGAALAVMPGGTVLGVAAALAGARSMNRAPQTASQPSAPDSDTVAAGGAACSTIAVGSPHVWIENHRAARFSDPTTVCSVTKVKGTVRQGSKTVFIDGLNAARHRDGSTCGGFLVPKTQHTFLGGPAVEGGAAAQPTVMPRSQTRPLAEKAAATGTDKGAAKGASSPGHPEPVAALGAVLEGMKIAVALATPATALALTVSLAAQSHVGVTHG